MQKLVPDSIEQHENVGSSVAVAKLRLKNAPAFMIKRDLVGTSNFAKPRVPDDVPTEESVDAIEKRVLEKQAEAARTQVVL